MDILQTLTYLGIPTSITGLLIFYLKRHIDKTEEKRNQKDMARQKNEMIVIKGVGAAITLGEATARAVQRMPDMKCNGDMTQALIYAQQVKHEQRDFLAEQGINNLY